MRGRAKGYSDFLTKLGFPGPVRSCATEAFATVRIGRATLSSSPYRRSHCSCRLTDTTKNTVDLLVAIQQHVKQTYTHTVQDIHPHLIRNPESCLTVMMTHAINPTNIYPLSIAQLKSRPRYQLFLSFSYILSPLDVFQGERPPFIGKALTPPPSLSPSPLSVVLRADSVWRP